MANISQIKLPDNTVYNIKDSSAARSSLIVITANTIASDTLTCSDDIDLSEGQLIFVFLNKATVGSDYMTISFNGSTAIDIYLTANTKMQAGFGESSILGLFYNNGNLYMINPPVAISTAPAAVAASGVSF